jgi:crotonobetainyl-CoA:carnitine CoA-transferase CaiB-like acyl-CoA transferase
MTRPFEGIRVIDVTHVLAGPFATYQLAVLGADVIKVEHPDEPDQSRGGGTDRMLNRRNMGTSFLTQASNKRSITLDLKRDADRDILKKLVTTADAFVENYRPGAFEALGLGYEAFVRDQSAAHLRFLLGFRPARTARGANRLRSRHPGDLGDHGHDRDRGRASGEVRLARD